MEDGTVIDVELKPLLRRLNRYNTNSLEAAAGLCVSRGHYEVTIEHMLLKMVDSPNADLQYILRHFEIEPARLQRALQRSVEDLKSGNAGKPVFSPVLIEWFQSGWLIASVDFDLTEIRSGALVAALVSNPVRYTGDGYTDILETISREELRRTLLDIVAGSTEDKPLPKKPGEAEPAEAGPRDDTALGRFTIDFTGRARAGEIDPTSWPGGERTIPSWWERPVSARRPWSRDSP
ncbi:hypothetical protein ACFL4G_09035 [Thermodesulfobacteriota bacterium]